MTKAFDFFKDTVRERLKAESDLNSTYQQKTGLYLVFVGFISTILVQILIKILELIFDGFAIMASLLLGGTLYFLFRSVFVLLEASISDDYSTPAPPSQYREHLRKLEDYFKSQGKASGELENAVAEQFESDMVDAWVEAIDKDFNENLKKGKRLKQASELLRCALGFLVLAIVIYFVHALRFKV